MVVAGGGKGAFIPVGGIVLQSNMGPGGAIYSIRDRSTPCNYSPLLTRVRGQGANQPARFFSLLHSA